MRALGDEPPKKRRKREHQQKPTREDKGKDKADNDRMDVALEHDKETVPPAATTVNIKRKKAKQSLISCADVIARLLIRAGASCAVPNGYEHSLEGDHG
jgi:hypothetical protein